jgi:hypothetical protein
MTDEQLSALLRLKRHEQPPAGYYDRLLQDVHRRQRAELLQRPLWKIALERVQVLFGEHSMGNLSYAGAMASVLVVGLAAIGLMMPSEVGQNERVATAGAVPEMVPNRFVTLQAPSAASIEAGMPSTSSSETTLISQPRYVIDARPVSYEPAPAISF